jgi:glycosyltransferase involved in cell wall biosynthesis
MKLSVITAVRNAERSIAATLRSVREQSGVSIEHIVIDGASTDGTLDVVRAEGQHVALTRSERDLGIYDAFNKGLALATGDIIAFLNAGDSYASADVASAVHQRFAGSPVDAILGDTLIVSADVQRRVLRTIKSRRFAPWQMAYGFMPAHPSMFLRREVYDRVGVFDIDYSQAGDFEFCLRAFCKQQIKYAYAPEVVVHMPTGGVSNSGWKSVMVNTREMRRACESNGVPTNLFKLLLRLPIKSLGMAFR